MARSIACLLRSLREPLVALALLLVVATSFPHVAHADDSWCSRDKSKAPGQIAGPTCHACLPVAGLPRTAVTLPTPDLPEPGLASVLVGRVVTTPLTVVTIRGPPSA